MIKGKRKNRLLREEPKKNLRSEKKTKNECEKQSAGKLARKFTVFFIPKSVFHVFRQILSQK